MTNRSERASVFVSRGCVFGKVATSDPVTVTSRFHMKRLLLVLFLAAAAMGQGDPCKVVGHHRDYGSFARWNSFLAWGNVELVPTAQGVGMIIFSYYAPFHMNPDLPLQNNTTGGYCPDRDVVLLGWWWNDHGEQRNGDEMFCPDGSRVDIFRRPVGWMISPVPLRCETGHQLRAIGLSVRRVPEYGVDRPICPVYAAYLLVPSWGEW